MNSLLNIHNPKIKFNWIAFVFIFFIKALFAQDTNTFSQNNFQRFAALPVLAYSEDTKIQYGALLILFFKPTDENSESSTIDFVALGTTKKQFGFRVSPDIWLLKNQIHVPSVFKFYNWRYSLYERGSRGDFEPIDKYNRKFFNGKIPFELGLGMPQNFPFRYGPVIEYEIRKDNLKDDTNKLTQGWFLGGGYKIVLDKRDNVNWPIKGFYTSFEEIFYGGDFSFRTENLDIRLYAPLFWKTSIALGLYFKQSKGENVPLGNLAGSDGTKRFRGIESGLWNDSQVLINQMEFRRPLFWRFSGTIFAESFQSAPYFKEFFKREVHYAIGFGGRLALNKSENLNARGDISIIDGKHLGLTVDLREAF